MNHYFCPLVKVLCGRRESVLRLLGSLNDKLHVKKKKKNSHSGEDERDCDLGRYCELIESDPTLTLHTYLPLCKTRKDLCVASL